MLHITSKLNVHNIRNKRLKFVNNYTKNNRLLFRIKLETGLRVPLLVESIFFVANHPLVLQ
jgi:hypothetical protein